MDATDDFHVFTPQSDHATSYYPTSEYSSNDVSLVTWENVSGNYIFNITFQEDVNISHVMVDLSFFIDGDYASSADIPPYLRHEQDFDIYIVNQSHSRICYNYTLQKYFYSVHIHDNKTIECTLLSSWTYILDPIQHQLPMEEWFCVGLSYVKLEGAWAYDYINWPQRAYNDQLWLTYDPYYWHKIIAAGAAALGVIIIITIVFLKKRKQKKKSPLAASQKQ